MPGQRDYDNTVAEEVFCTEEEAEEAGFIPAKQQVLSKKNIAIKTTRQI